LPKRTIANSNLRLLADY